MARILIGLLIGLLLGGIATFYFFVGVPASADPPGVPIAGPDPGGPPAGTVQVVLRQEFFNDILSTIFTEMNPPSFALGGSGGSAPSTPDGCGSLITVLPEGSGVRTGVTLANNRLEAPIAFNGGYSSPFGCFRFTGWANSVMQLRFDRDSQSVVGQLNVETVNLDGVNPLVNAIVTPLVQSTLNSRVNPVRIIDGAQTAVNTPVASVKANLVARVADIRAEVREKSLNLFIEYDFAGGPFTLGEAPPPL